MNLELIKYCSFGYQCPVVLLNIDYSKQIYTLEGVQSLMGQCVSDKKALIALQAIHERLQQLKHVEFEELSFDDISGQNRLF
jgi:hypothetical protein